jgi:hypothetical protein
LGANFDPPRWVAGVDLRGGARADGAFDLNSGLLSLLVFLYKGGGGYEGEGSGFGVEFVALGAEGGGRGGDFENWCALRPPAQCPRNPGGCRSGGDLLFKQGGGVGKPNLREFWTQPLRTTLSPGVEALGGERRDGGRHVGGVVRAEGGGAPEGCCGVRVREFVRTEQAPHPSCSFFSLFIS